MKQYNFFQAWIMSFYSSSLYRDVGKNWRGIGFGYLLVLLAFFSIPDMYQLYTTTRDWITLTAPLAPQMPTIVVEKGHAVIDKPVPYIMLDKQGNVLAVIDTSTKVAKPEIPFFLTTEKLYYQGQELITLSDLQYNFKIGPQETTNFFDSLTNGLSVIKWILAYPLLVAGALLYRLIQILLYGLLGLLFSNITKASLSYGSILRLSAVAITPAIILSTIFNVASISFPMQLLLYFVLSMIYLYRGIKANA